MTWKCENCHKLFPERFQYSRHAKSCEIGIKHIFPRGRVGPKKTILQKITELGIPFPEYYYPYKIAYDLGCMFEPCTKPNSPKIIYEQDLIPASVSVCSNVPGYTEPKCFISEGGPHELVVRMYKYMEEIADRVYELPRMSTNQHWRD